MKLSLNWLKDYVDIDISVKALAQRLTSAGLEVTSIERKGKDYLLEIEVTTNRADCLGIIGIAREVAAVTNKRLKLPKPLLWAKQKDRQILTSKDRLTIQIQEKKACLRYVGRVIEEVKVKSSPEGLSQRLLAVGIRPVNNVVDVTNYCLLEFGQPLHVFDYDKLLHQSKSALKIVVRYAGDGEEIITIDGIKRRLDKNILVIASQLNGQADRPIAIAGIMGGKETEVTEETKNVLLESAYFDPVTIKEGAKALGMITESSYRFERGVDLQAVGIASRRASLLIAELCGGKVKVRIDVGKKRMPKRAVTLRPSKVNSVLGISISTLTVKRLLKSLGFCVAPLKDGKNLTVTVPSFRQDITRQIDLIEEVIRLYGYEKIPSLLPAIRPPVERPCPEGRLKEALIRDMLISCGLTEVITYSLISKELLEKANLNGEEELAKVSNPISLEHQVLRSTLLPGLFKVIAHNLNRGLKDLRLFELAHIYSWGREERCLGIALIGKRFGDWLRAESPLDLFDLKGIVETLLEVLRISRYEFTPKDFPLFSSGKSMRLRANGDSIGFLGEVSDEVTDRFELSGKVFAAEIKLEELLPYTKLKRRFSPLPKYPPVFRNLALIVREDIPSSRIVSCLLRTGAGLIAEVKIFDRYYGKQIPPGFKGLAYSLEYRHKDRTLTDEEVNSLHSKICQKLQEELDVRVR